MFSALSVNIGAEYGSETGVEVSAADDVSSYNWFSLEGIAGEITTELVTVDLDDDSVEDSLLVGSRYALQAYDIMTGEKLFEHLTGEEGSVTSITVVGDADSDGYSDVLFTSTSQFFPNVILLSGSDGDTIWSFRPSEKSYFMGMIWTDVELRSWDSALVDGSIVLSAWKYVYALDLRTGTVEWRYSGENDIWSIVAVDDIDGDGGDDIVAGGQDGFLYAISGANGGQIWKRKITEDIGTDRGSFPASVWSVLALGDLNGDGSDEVAVSSEEGHVRMISSSDGEIVWDKKIMPLVLSMSETAGIDDRQFFNPRLLNAGDFDGDGRDDIVAISNIRFQEWGSYGLTNVTVISSNPSLEGESLLTISRDNSEQGSLEGVRLLSTVVSIVGDAAPDIALLTSDSRIQIVDGGEEEMVRDIEIPSYGGGEGPQLKIIGDVTEDGVDDIVVTGGSACILCYDSAGLNNSTANQPEWMIMPMGSSEILPADDLNDDGLADLIILISAESGGDGWDDGGYETYEADMFSIAYWGETEESYLGISAIDRSDGSKIWTLLPSASDSGMSAEFTKVSLDSDFTGDGIRDILCVLESEWNESMLLVAIDAVDGSTIWFSEAGLAFNEWPDMGYGGSRVKSAVSCTDITGDEVPDAIMGFPESRMVLFNGNNGDIEMVYDNDPFYDNSNFTKGALNMTDWMLPYEVSLICPRDASDRLVVYGDSRILIFGLDDLSMISPDPLMNHWSEFGFDQKMVSLIDGCEEPFAGRTLAFMSYYESSVVWTAIDVADCEVISSVTLEQSGLLGLLPLANEMSDDDLPDMLVFSRDTMEYSAPPEIRAIDSETGSQLWSADPFDMVWDYSMSEDFPAAPIRDYDNDGTDEITAVGQYDDGDGLIVWVLNGRTGAVIREEFAIPRSSSVDEWDNVIPCSSVLCPGDLTGDGVNDILADSDGMAHLIDGASLKRVKSVMSASDILFDGADLDGDGVQDPLFASREGFLMSISSEFSLSISAPEDGSELSSRRITVEWNDLGEGVFIYVAVDGIPSAIAQDPSEAEILLPPGEHVVSIVCMDAIGSMVADSVTVTAESHDYSAVVNAIGIVAIAAAVSVSIVRKRLMKKRHAREFSGIKENGADAQEVDNE